MSLAMSDSSQNSVNLNYVRYFVLWLMENHNDTEQNVVVLFLLFYFFEVLHQSQQQELYILILICVLWLSQ